MAQRCLTLPTLKMVGEQRQWNGVASTTQLLNGTMHEYLKLTKDYAVEPKSRAFMLQGTKHHANLEEVARQLGMAAEIALSDDRDIFDVLEIEGTEIVLTDYKLWGSFKVAQAKGLVQTGKQPDPSGEVYRSSGKWGKAGSPKMVPIFEPDPDKADNMEAEHQLNHYRVMLKDKFGVTINRMQLQVTVRDGGTYVAKNRGVTELVYMIPIPIIDDGEIRDYFNYKQACLAFAMEHGWSEVCNDHECWGGRRCKGYCDVWMHCTKGRGEHENIPEGGLEDA